MQPHGSWTDPGCRRCPQRTLRPSRMDGRGTFRRQLTAPGWSESQRTFIQGGRCREEGEGTVGKKGRGHLGGWGLNEAQGERYRVAGGVGHRSSQIHYKRKALSPFRLFDAFKVAF